MIKSFCTTRGFCTAFARLHMIEVRCKNGVWAPAIVCREDREIWALNSMDEQNIDWAAAWEELESGANNIPEKHPAASTQKSVKDFHKWWCWYMQLLPIVLLTL